MIEDQDNVEDIRYEACSLMETTRWCCVSVSWLPKRCDG